MILFFTLKRSELGLLRDGNTAAFCSALQSEVGGDARFGFDLVWFGV
jgi:hypothetical protein